MIKLDVRQISGLKTTVLLIDFVLCLLRLLLFVTLKDRFRYDRKEVGYTNQWLPSSGVGHVSLVIGILSEDLL